MGETSSLIALIILSGVGFVFTTMSIIYLIKKPSINILANILRIIFTVLLALLTMYATNRLHYEYTRFDFLKEVIEQNDDIS